MAAAPATHLSTDDAGETLCTLAAAQSHREEVEVVRRTASGRMHAPVPQLWASICAPWQWRNNGYKHWTRSGGSDVLA